MIVPFQPEHLSQLMLQPSQVYMQPMLANTLYGKYLFDAGPAYSCVIDDMVLACAGLIPQWENRTMAWALIASEAGKHFVSIHRAVKRTFAMHPYRRIETTVNVGFEEGYRWANLLGFEREGLMRKYLPDGGDCYLYARVL